MKSVVAISLPRYRNSRWKNSRGNLLYFENSSRYDQSIVDNYKRGLNGDAKIENESGVLIT